MHCNDAHIPIKLLMFLIHLLLSFCVCMCANIPLRALLLFDCLCKATHTFLKRVCWCACVYGVGLEFDLSLAHFLCVYNGIKSTGKQIN